MSRHLTADFINFQVEEAPISKSTNKNDDVYITKSPDITLRVGGELELHVNSHVLGVASKVFETMLQPKWFDRSKVGGAAELPVLELPEDNPMIVEVLCMMIHFRGNEISTPKSLEMIVALVMLMEKYDCLNVGKLSIQLWLVDFPWYDERVSYTPEGDLMKNSLWRAIIAYIYCEEKDFHIATKQLALWKSGSYRTLANITGFAIFPDNFLLILEENRTRVRAEFVSRITEWIRPYFTMDPWSYNEVGTIDELYYNSSAPVKSATGNEVHTKVVGILARCAKEQCSIAETAQRMIDRGIPSIVQAISSESMFSTAIDKSTSTSHRFTVVVNNEEVFLDIWESLTSAENAHMLCGFSLGSVRRSLMIQDQKPILDLDLDGRDELFWNP